MAIPRQQLPQRGLAIRVGTYEVTLGNGQKLQVSRLQSRALRDTLLKL